MFIEGLVSSKMLQSSGAFMLAARPISRSRASSAVRASAPLWGLAATAVAVHLLVQPAWLRPVPSRRSADVSQGFPTPATLAGFHQPGRVHECGRHAMQAAPWDMLRGSMLDPNYWKQQYFLAGRLKTMLPPNREQYCALELAPSEHKYLGYLCPEKDSGSRLDRYIAFGEVKPDVAETLENQGQIFNVAVGFQPWESGKKLAWRSNDMVDVVLVAPTGCIRLGGELQYALAEVSNVLTYDGRVLLVVSEEDEAMLGAKLETILGEQDLQDLDELEDLQLASSEASASQLLRSAGLRLVKVIRDECGLTVGICIKREATKAPKAPRTSKRMKKSTPRATSKASSSNFRGGVTRNRPPKRRKR